MYSVTVTEGNDEHWGKCITITNGVVELVATLDIGPRIIRFGIVNGPNEFYEVLEPEVDDPIDPDFAPFGNEGNWHIRGGHRFWVAPEALPRTYYPDNKPIRYEILNNGVRLMPEVQNWTQFELKLEVCMANDGQVTVRHYLTNRSPFTVECAPWAVTVMKAGGLQVVPQSKKDVFLLHNRTISLWTYTEMDDSRVHWGKDYITLRPHAEIDHAFKFGVHTEHGYAAYFNHGNLFVKQYDPVEDGNYPDGGVSYETYTNGDMCEMETLGVLQPLAPGATVTHDERWRLIPNVPEPQSDEEIARSVEQYIL